MAEARKGFPAYLGIGSFGDAVKVISGLLKPRGAKAQILDKEEKLTGLLEMGVREFQQSNRLKVTGHFDQPTQKAFKKAFGIKNLDTLLKPGDRTWAVQSDLQIHFYEQ